MDELVLMLSSEEPLAVREASWRLINITGTGTEESTEAIRLGVVPPLVRLLCRSTDARTVEHVLDVLGNIAEDGPGELISHDVLAIICNLLPTSNGVEVLRDCSRIFYGLCTEWSPALFGAVPTVLTLSTHPDEETAQFASLALAKFLTFGNDARKTAMRADVGPKLKARVRGASDTLLWHIFCCFSEISAGDTACTQYLDDSGVFGVVCANVCHSNAEVVVNAVITVGNFILEGGALRERALEANLGSQIIQRLVAECTETVRKELMWLLTFYMPG